MSSFPSVHRALAITCALLPCAWAFPTPVVGSDEQPPNLDSPVDIVAIDGAAGRASVTVPGSVEIRVLEAGDTLGGLKSSCPELTVVQVEKSAMRVRCGGPLADRTVWLRRDADGETRLVMWSADGPVVEPSEPTHAPPEAEHS